MHNAMSKTRQEQDEVLGVTLPVTDNPKTIFGMCAWRSFWSMGKGAGASAFMRSPVALAARGHNVHLLQPCDKGEDGLEEYAGVHFHKYCAPKVFSNPDQFVVGRLLERFWRYLFYQLHAPRFAHQLIEALSPDLLVAYGIMVTPAARRVAVKAGLPFAGRYFGNTISLALDNPVRWTCNFMERYGFTTPHQVMVLTNDGSPALEVLRRLKVDLTPVHYLRNGIPEDVFVPGPKPRELMKSLGIGDDAFVLMTVTRLAPEKRLDRTLRILAELRKTVPQAVAILLGSGPDLEQLRQLAKDLGVADAVHFPGAVQNNQLAEWYRLSDVVLSLLDRTNASNPVFEAMACERCVLALDVGTTNEVVKHEETGILISPDRENEITAVLAELAADPARRDAIGKRARPFITRTCGSVTERMMREIEALETLIHTGRPVPGNLI
jgi:glycosyltransferase involved in cell wall biosynthesis